MIKDRHIFWLLELSIFLFIIVFNSLGTFRRNRIWKEGASLWTDVVKKSPQKARPRNYLGLAFKEKGDLQAAVKRYKMALKLNPMYANVYSNLGICYFDLKMVDEAIAEFKKAISIRPNHADAHYNLGIAYGEKGMNKEAFSEMRKAKELGAKF